MLILYFYYNLHNANSVPIRCNGIRNFLQKHTFDSYKEIMMKKLFISTCFVTALFVSPMAYTQNLIISDEFGQSVASGKITDMGIEELTLQIGENEFLTVETDDIDVDEDYLDDLISVGDNVRVIGKFDDSILEADEIMLLSEDSNIYIEAN